MKKVFLLKSELGQIIYASYSKEERDSYFESLLFKNYVIKEDRQINENILKEEAFSKLDALEKLVLNLGKE